MGGSFLERAARPSKRDYGRLGNEGVFAVRRLLGVHEITANLPGWITNGMDCRVEPTAVRFIAKWVPKGAPHRRLVIPAEAQRKAGNQ